MYKDTDKDKDNSKTTNLIIFLGGGNLSKVGIQENTTVAVQKYIDWKREIGMKEAGNRTDENATNHSLSNERPK